MTNNVVLIVMDSVRADHCSAYGYSDKTTPTLSEFNARFDSAYANAPYTPASVPSLLTSRYPLEDGHVAFSDYQTIPDALHNADYTTAAVYNNAQIRIRGFDETFQHVCDLTQEKNQMKSQSSATEMLKNIRSSTYNLLKKHDELAAVAKDTYLRFAPLPIPHPPDSVVISKANELMDTLPEPYFLYIHLMNTHHPYVFDPDDFSIVSNRTYNNKKYRRLLARARTSIEVGDFVWEMDKGEKEYIQAAYDASIRNVDRQIKQLVNNCKMDDNIIVTSDHGEELWDRDQFGHSGRSNKPRSMTLYEEMVKVPLFISGPDVNNGAIDSLVSLVDIFPTILDFAGCKTNETIRGRSLLNYMNISENKNGMHNKEQVIIHATSPGDPDGFYEDPKSKYLGAVIKQPFKLHYHEGGSGKIYNLKSDKNEENPIEDQRISDGLIDTLLETINIKKENNTKKRQLGTEARSTLKELGYLE